MASAFDKKLTPSSHLAAVIGAEPVSRPDVVSRMWAYIKQHKLQDEADKRTIVSDDKLRGVFGKDRVTMFEMNKLLSAHLA